MAIYLLSIPTVLLPNLGKLSNGHGHPIVLGIDGSS